MSGTTPRTMAARFALAAIVALVPAGLGACGDDDDSAATATTESTTTTTTAMPDEFAAALDGLCAQLSDLGDLPDSIDAPDELGGSIFAATDSLENLENDLDQLGDEARSDQFTELSSTAQSGLDTAEEALEALVSGDASEATDLFEQAEQDLMDARDQLGDLGFENCDAPDGDVTTSTGSVSE